MPEPGWAKPGGPGSGTLEPCGCQEFTASRDEMRSPGWLGKQANFLLQIGPCMIRIEGKKRQFVFLAATPQVSHVFLVPTLYYLITGSHACPFLKPQADRTNLIAEVQDIQHLKAQSPCSSFTWCSWMTSQTILHNQSWGVIPVYYTIFCIHTVCTVFCIYRTWACQREPLVCLFLQHACA